MTKENFGLVMPVERFLGKRIVYIPLLILIFLLIADLLLRIGPVLKGLFLFLKVVGLPFAVALVLAYLLNPVVNGLEKYGLNRSLAVLLIYLLFFGGISFFIYRGYPVFLRQIQELREHLPAILEKVDGWMDHFQRNQDHLPSGLREGLQQGAERIDKAVSGWFARMMDGMGGFMMNMTSYLLIPFILFYLLKDFNHLHQLLLRFIPRTHRKKLLLVLRDIDDGLGKYIRGQLLVATFVGAVVTLGYWLIGFPYPVIFGLIAMVFNIIPYLGPFLAAGPAVLIALTVSWKLAVYSALVNFVAQFVEGNILSPLIVGKSIHIHPLMIILAILAGGEIGGIAGLILAVPVMVMLKVVLYHVVRHFAAN